MALTNAQYDAVMRRYDEIRERGRYLQQQHTAKVMQEIPEIGSLIDETAARSLAAARRRIEDPAADLTDYREAMAEIGRRKDALLTAHGYGADYLDPVYACPICKDTGYAEGAQCVCFRRITAELLYGSSSLKEILKEENFGRFSFDWYSDTISDEATGMTPREAAEKAVHAARDLFHGDRISGNLYLYGATGVGKTFLTHCIADEADRHGLSVLYFSAGDLFDQLAESAFARTGESSAVRELVSSADLLVIDDLGTELANTFTASELFRVINERILSDKSTVISTNLALKELSEKYSERVLSRITSAYTILKLSGDDIRIRKKLQAR